MSQRRSSRPTFPTKPLAFPYMFAGLLIMGIGVFAEELGVSDGTGGLVLVGTGLVLFFCSTMERIRR